MEKGIKVAIEAMLPEHWTCVRSIYENGISTGNATFQATAPATWEDWNKGHLPHSRFIAVTDSQVVGWVALSPTSARDCYRGVCETSIYIDDSYHGKGVGTALMAELIRSSEEHGVWSLYASIFPENGASVGLYRKFGFRLIGYREKIAKHKNRWRDTVLLERRSKVVGT